MTLAPTDVVLVNPPPDAQCGEGFHETGEPIGLCYMAAELRRRGFAVFLLDAFTLGISARQAAEIVAALRPRLAVGISILETGVPGAAALVSELRAGGHGGMIVGGNYFASLNPGPCFAAVPGLDCIIRGEGELAFADLVQAVRDGAEWRAIPGCAWPAADGDLIDNGIAPQPDIDTLAEPARDCLPAVLDAGGTANVVTGRGCYANCSFCSIAAFFTPGEAGRRYRLRSAAAVADEMRDIKRRFHVHRFLLPDDNFMPPGKDRAERVTGFCRALDDAGIEFTITCRANDIERDHVRRLKQVGLVGVYLGLESFLPRRLKLFRKGLPPQANHDALAALAAEGVYVKIGFIMFDPHSTLEEVQAELALLRGVMEAPRTVHTSIDNIIRHSTYPLELQAGTGLTRSLAAAGEAFPSGKGWVYRHADPRVQAVRELAARLLHFEGRSFAVLRRLYAQVAYAKPDGGTEADPDCTALWRRLGHCHFDLYETFLAECARARPRPDVVARAIAETGAALDAIDADGIAALRRLGGDMADAISWLRMVVLPTAGDGPDQMVFDPVTGSWLALDPITIKALGAWTRTPRDAIAAGLARDHGPATAGYVLARVESLLAAGHFLTSKVACLDRDVDAFRHASAAALADLATGGAQTRRHHDAERDTA